MDGSSAPLADYFWIAGVEDISYHDNEPVDTRPLSCLQLDDTIREDSEHELPHQIPESPTQPPSKDSARFSRRSSFNRLSKLSTSEPRFSIQGFDENDGTRSNRSSATIRPIPPVNFGNGTDDVPPTPTDAAAPAAEPAPQPGGGGQGTGFTGLPDFDFDKALMKFAAERENFLDDLSFSAGAKLQSRPPMVGNPRAERIKAEEGELSGRMSPLKSIKGSIRRKISFRDMNSVKRQTVTPRARPASVRTTKRLSNYNSVIPPPEPLNLDPDMHPLKRRFEPKLLDRYPKETADDIARRGKFPDYVPMFAFPNDIQIVSSDERPRATWHGFTMTSDDNSKVYGITVIVWTPLSPDVADQVEKKCESWRQKHMSDEERELAASLGARLAAERAHLSQLLAELPTIPSGSSARDALDDHISTVEEKISLMTEMLRPLRHGAASKIDGLTAGDTGLWTPRAYGIMGRDVTKITFWKEWLRAIIVPMTDGTVLRIPPSSPKVGRWQPLERYVVNLCMEAVSPISSKTQVELGVRELRLYCRKEAINELPGSRNIDIYALFRCLSLENIVALFEYAMSESRIIFISSYTAMLHLACHALVNLLYPFKWASVFIPILPARLLSALDAPCPYIVGIERRYDNIELPEDDYVLVDLDKDTIDATSQPHRLPRQHRRKLLSLLQVAAPHKLRFGVATGAPPYAIEAFPYDSFSVENESLFSTSAPSATLGKWVSQNSSTFGEPGQPGSIRKPIFNAFSHAKPDSNKSDRPTTARSGKTSPNSSLSPRSGQFPPMPTTPNSRTDSGFALAGTLREKRSGHFDSNSRRSSSFGVDQHPPPLHRPSLPFLNGHGANLSISSISVDSQSSYNVGYAPSSYATSTIAASTVMPNMLVQPVENTDTTVWVEGHCMEWNTLERDSYCDICDDRSEGDGLFKCRGCGCLAHNRCLGFVCLVCPVAFHADRVRAAFVRCFASLLYTYRKYMGRPNKQQKESGQLFAFDMNGFIRSLPYDQQEYAVMMRDTQAFNEFIHEREKLPASNVDVRLFDEILVAKKARGRPQLSAGLSRLSTLRANHGALAGGFGPSRQPKLTGFLADTSDHIWRTAAVPVPNANFQGDYRSIVTRVPTRLDPSLIKEPRSIQGAPKPEQRGKGFLRKAIGSGTGTKDKK
ncbi:hypothetical protein VSDG_05804 [Cytospora chrysosperma]|uniref:UDENN domain-containing protein n=1 Tax=Cytospora chrysosperma TaxID=252740 RepID=A0A423VVK7_CYTCH|nr:hypothetical protein VSDG_05804 [Valsa sordida]